MSNHSFINFYLVILSAILPSNLTPSFKVRLAEFLNVNPRTLVKAHNIRLELISGKTRPNKPAHQIRIADQNILNIILNFAYENALMMPGEKVVI